MSALLLVIYDIYIQQNRIYCTDFLLPFLWSPWTWSMACLKGFKHKSSTTEGLSIITIHSFI